MKKILEIARCRPCFECGASGMSLEGGPKTERHGLLLLPEHFAKHMDPSVVVAGDDPEGRARAEVYLLSTLWKLQLDMLHRHDELKDEGKSGMDAEARERLRAVLLEGVEEAARTVKRLTRQGEPFMPHVRRVNVYEVAEQCGYHEDPEEHLKGLGEADYAELEEEVCQEYRRRYGRAPETGTVVVKGQEVQARLFLEMEREFIVEWLDGWDEAGRRCAE